VLEDVSDHISVPTRSRHVQHRVRILIVGASSNEFSRDLQVPGKECLLKRGGVNHPRIGHGSMSKSRWHLVVDVRVIQSHESLDLQQVAGFGRLHQERHAQLPAVALTELKDPLGVEVLIHQAKDTHGDGRLPPESCTCRNELRCT